MSEGSGVPGGSATFETSGAWTTLAHVRLDPLAPDWRERLAQRLLARGGERPRRIGAWAELALYGALMCLEESGETVLPADASLRVASLSGPLSAARAAVQQGASGLPMPFTFMQIQPSQMLAALGRALAWQGDACCVVSRDRQQVLQLGLRECGAAGLLFGWVEEDRCTEWWRFLRKV